jgi:hypothetical protein
VTIDGRGVEAAADWGDLRSPENYVGWARTERFASPGGARAAGDAERERRAECEEEAAS